MLHFRRKGWDLRIMVVSWQATAVLHTGQRSGSSGKTAAIDFVSHFVAKWFVVEARSCRWISVERKTGRTQYHSAHRLHCGLDLKFSSFQTRRHDVSDSLIAAREGSAASEECVRFESRVALRDSGCEGRNRARRSNQTFFAGLASASLSFARWASISLWKRKEGAANTVRHTDCSEGMILNFRHFRLDGMTCRIR